MNVEIETKRLNSQISDRNARRDMFKSRSPSPTTAAPVRSASETEHQSSDEDAVALRKLTRKIDLRIIPLFIFLYTMTFLDRVNIGNARLWHLEADLGMAGYDYNLAVLVFYIPYMLLEIPSNMLLNRLKPRYYIASLVFLWGLTITLAGFSTRFAHLVAARVLLGVFEAGMFPGCLFLLATWYPRHALLTRTALFLLANDIAGSLSGLLGAGLGALDGVLAGGVLYLAVCVTAYSISVFTPTILRTFGWGPLKSNLLSTPVRVASGVVSVLVGVVSDRTRRRGVYCLGGFATSIVGLLVVMVPTDGGVRYAGLYLAAVGIYVCQPLVIAWTVNQLVGNVKRGTATAFAISCGQLGGIISAVVFPAKDEPQYVAGISTCIGFQAVGIAMAVIMWVCCQRENQARERGEREYRRNLPEDEVRRLGEKHPDFRYTL
ncbi:Centromere protein C 1 [Verticillium dahliae VDG2]|nr:Centromere protein C 1 [Verticillium dahliae VDG2]